MKLPLLVFTTMALVILAAVVFWPAHQGPETAGVPAQDEKAGLSSAPPMAAASVEPETRAHGRDAGAVQPQTSEVHGTAASSEPIQVPSYIEEALDDPGQRPSLAVLKQLSPDDHKVLVKLFRANDDLSDKRALTWMLAWTGDEEVVGLFKEALFRTYSEERLEGFLQRREDWTLHSMVYLLGLLAAKHDSAFEVIKAGIDPDFWRRNAPWITDLDVNPFMMVTHSILALGLSGRPEAAEMIEQLKTHDFDNEPDSSPINLVNVSGAMANAAFHMERIQEHGLEFAREALFAVDHSEVVDQWYIRGNGREWRQWREEIRQNADRREQN